MSDSKDTAYFLSTERLGFRKWHHEGLPLAVGLWGDIEVTKLFDNRGALSQEQVQERLDREIMMEARYGIQYWPVFSLDENHHIGACGLRPYGKDPKVREIGFHICSAHWRKGYATEAAHAVIRYAFDHLKLEGLFAGHNPQNKSSGHLLSKLGFTYTHDETYPPTGLKHPSYLLKADQKDFL